MRQDSGRRHNPTDGKSRATRGEHAASHGAGFLTNQRVTCGRIGKPRLICVPCPFPATKCAREVRR
jgi:hypothetical protein